MAKAKSASTASVPAASSEDGKYDKWAVRDAMHTMMRAGELTKDSKMMGLVRKEAARYAKESQELADKAAALAKKGLISEKAMAKMKDRG